MSELEKRALAELRRSQHDDGCHPSEGKHSVRCVRIKAMLAMLDSGSGNEGTDAERAPSTRRSEAQKSSSTYSPEGGVMSIRARKEKEKDLSAELIHQTIPDMEGTEPRPNMTETERALIEDAISDIDIALDAAWDVCESPNAQLWKDVEKAKAALTFIETHFQRQVGSASVSANSGIAGPMSPAQESNLSSREAQPSASVMEEDSDAIVSARICLLDHYRKAGLLHPGMDERNKELHSLIDALMAAVRAADQAEIARLMATCHSQNAEIETKDRKITNLNEWREFIGLAVDQLRRRAEAAEAQLQREAQPDPGAEGKWLPIETAPKDGTEILAFGPFVPTGDTYMDIAHWNVWGDEAFWDWGGDDSQPTHWMPLPAPPVGSGNPVSVAEPAERFGAQRKREGGKGDQP